MSHDPPAADVPLDPRQDWRTRLPVPGTRNPADQPDQSVTPRPRNPPPAPQRCTAPHNLFTREEVSAGLRLLAAGLEASQPAKVLITHTNGGEDDPALEEFAGITYVDDVVSIHISWTYQDGSSVTGNLIDRAAAGSLAIKGGGLALHAAQQCVDHLWALRPQRAGLRGWLAGLGPETVGVLAMASLFMVYLLTVPAATTAYTGLSTPLTRGSLITAVALVAIAWAASRIITRLFARARRRFTGTRLAQQRAAHRVVLTPEAGVLTGVLALVVSVVGVLIDVITG